MALVLTACDGGGGDGSDDSGDEVIDTCWRGDGEVREGGRVEVGTGFRAFEKLVDEQQLFVQAGAQGLHHFMVNVNMWGMDPGDLSYDAVENPQTRLSAFFEDGTPVDALDCSYPIFYVPREDGNGYQLYSGRPLVLADGMLDDIAGKRVRIVAEVVDAELRYASDEIWVVAMPPTATDPNAPDLGNDKRSIDPDAARAAQ
jgi:hypothetical protein